MSTMEQAKRIPAEDEILASFLLVSIGRLTGWNATTSGDPVYLTAEEAVSLATEGISLLSHFLPRDATRQISTAIERLPHAKRGTRDQILLEVGRSGGVLPAPGSNPEGPPGCCVWINGRLVCVR